MPRQQRPVFQARDRAAVGGRADDAVVQGAAHDRDRLLALAGGASITIDVGHYDAECFGPRAPGALQGLQLRPGIDAQLVLEALQPAEPDADVIAHQRENLRVFRGEETHRAGEALDRGARRQPGIHRGGLERTQPHRP